MPMEYYKLVQVLLSPRAELHAPSKASALELSGERSGYVPTVAYKIDDGRDASGAVRCGVHVLPERGCRTGEPRMGREPGSHRDRVLHPLRDLVSGIHLPPGCRHPDESSGPRPRRRADVLLCRHGL